MKHLAPAAFAAFLILTACTGSEADTPDPVGILISCETGADAPASFAAPKYAWELPPKERENCGGFWVADSPDGAHQHEYTELEREALDAANAREAHLPYLYGRCARSHLGFHNEEMWETADDNVTRPVAPIKELEGALILCPNHPEAEIVKERAAEFEAQREQAEWFILHLWVLYNDVRYRVRANTPLE